MDSSSSASPPTLPPTSYRIGISIYNNGWSPEIKEETWSCLLILLTFWFFVCMAMILGLYGSTELVLGPNCSRPLSANSVFVQDIKVKGNDESNNGPMLYGFLKPPPLDVESTWSASRNVTIRTYIHKEWIYYLNTGAKIHISYSVVPDVFYPLILVIAQGRDNLLQWIEDPSRPNTTLYWNLIHGNGIVEQSIAEPSDYYIAIGNLNQLEIEVMLSFQIKNIVHNTTGAYYRCALNHKLCAMKLFLSQTTFGVLTTPSIEDSGKDEWYVELSYGPRWITYFVGSGVLTVSILLLFKLFTDLCNIARPSPHETAVVTTERTPMLTHKDDDHMSLGSSYDSVSNDEDDEAEFIADETNVLKNGEIKNTQQLCSICCDAQRDSFFLPCGHCAVCFTCGIRILDEAGSCPVCRRKMKKVRKIFTV